MGRHTLEYPKSKTNTVRRKADRATYALSAIHSLINASHFLDVAFNPPDDSPFPTILPMIGHMGSFDRPSADLGDPLDLYLHGYVSSRMMNLARSSASSSQGGDDEEEKQGQGQQQQQGLPVCIAASHVDALILATSPFNHSYNYRSATLFGHATLVTDDAEKLYAMELITNGIVPGRWAASRQPPTPAEMQSTSILRVAVASGSAKFRDGGVRDDRHDLEDDEAQGRVWTGVLPVFTRIGEPIPTGYSKVETPADVKDFVREYNRENEEYVFAAAKK
ncbi:hypothetical protein BBK36DRAFT_1123286 [Trichoderma citrinoviride]|uniref:Flavin-nucleotide-binding protein n=1 Tax=Trichoderma citrinoviride TaxID=58853 RepID=A0A2T4B5J4_9HYPO|nr:hypothetical protein BBK36DRAFT_1123286 [Trichoderma citrinoviride]PTB64606.1 hypothetical protein BBK36DRAFT_1123286 [Trichoderma citrinoviride]